MRCKELRVVTTHSPTASSQWWRGGQYPARLRFSEGGAARDYLRKYFVMRTKSTSELRANVIAALAMLAAVVVGAALFHLVLS